MATFNAGQIVRAAALSALGVIRGLSAAATTAAQNLTTTPADITGASVTFTTTRPNALAWIVINVDMEAIAATNATGTVWLNVDGVDQTAQATFNGVGNAGQRDTPGQSYSVTLATAGSHTLKLVGSASANSVVRTRSTHTTLTVLLFDLG